MRETYIVSGARYDAVIVGGSFAGLSAAMQLARARRTVLVLDTSKPRNRFARASHGFFGQDGRPPLEIMETARRQVTAYPTVDFAEAAATDAAFENGAFTVEVGSGEYVRADRLVLATGVKDTLPSIPGMEELWGTGVMHCPYCHGYEVAGRPLAVLSSGEFSVHQAMLVRDWSDHVTLLTNGTPLSLEDRQRLQARGVSIEEAPVARLIADGRDLAAIAFQDGRTVPFGGLFIHARYMFTSPLAERLGCEIEQGPFGPVVKTSDFKETTVSNVFAAGDLARLNHSATFASADGVMAGVAAHRSLIFS